MALNPRFTDTPKNIYVSLSNAETGTETELFDFSDQGGILEHLQVCNTNEAAVTLELLLEIAATGTYFLINTIDVPSNAGFDGTVDALDLMQYLSNFVDNAGNYIFKGMIASKIFVKATIAEGKYLKFTGFGELYSDAT